MYSELNSRVFIEFRSNTKLIREKVSLACSDCDATYTFTSEGSMHRIVSKWNKAKKTSEIASRIFDVISEYNEKDNRTLFRVDYSFSNPQDIFKADLLKVALRFEEDRIYESIPSLRNLNGSLSFKKLKYHGRLYQGIDIGSFGILESSGRGIDTTNLKRGWISMQYFRGNDALAHKPLIWSSMSSIESAIRESVSNPRKYSDEERREFVRITESTRKMKNAFSSIESFIRTYPEIAFTTDLSEDKRVLSSRFSLIRDRIYDLLSNAEIKEKIELNYDSDASRLQIRGGEILVEQVREMDFVGTKLIGGRFHNCQIQDCKLENVVCTATGFYGCEIENSIIVDSALANDNTSRHSTFTGKASLIDGELENCFVSDGVIKSTVRIKDSKISKTVKVSK